ncbi:unnamed protein product [Toxocara canis]|uniref:Transposase n=1 Tax=Toxocara canis TaxID=6265 RepID=A0A183UCQ9_TOXCA|nr:unnamed protein product [Toxocara canis]
MRKRVVPIRRVGDPLPAVSSFITPTLTPLMLLAWAKYFAVCKADGTASSLPQVSVHKTDRGRNGHFAVPFR